MFNKLIRNNEQFDQNLQLFFFFFVVIKPNKQSEVTILFLF